MIQLKPNTLFIKRAVQKLLNQGGLTIQYSFGGLIGNPSDNAGLVNLINSKVSAGVIAGKEILYRATISLGDIIGPEQETTISIPVQLDNNYTVLGVLVGYSPSFHHDVDVFHSVRDKTTNNFILVVREVNGDTQDMKFDFIII